MQLVGEFISMKLHNFIYKRPSLSLQRYWMRKIEIPMKRETIENNIFLFTTEWSQRYITILLLDGKIHSNHAIGGQAREYFFFWFFRFEQILFVQNTRHSRLDKQIAWLSSASHRLPSCGFARERKNSVSTWYNGYVEWTRGNAELKMVIFLLHSNGRINQNSIDTIYHVSHETL